MTLAAVALAAAAAPIAYASSRATAPRVEIRGTVSPLVAKGLAHVVGTPSAAKQVQAVVAFKPRNAILLHWLAERSTARPGMSNAEIGRLFAPRPATVAAVRSYLSANGLSVIDATDMSLVVSGTAAAADNALGVGLRLYRDARGTTYQAPSANVRLPRGIASVVQSVDGLDTSLKLHPHYQIAKQARQAGGGASVRVVPHSVTGCGRATTFQHNQGAGYLPQDLAASTGYNHDALVGAGSDGAGQQIGFVEFSQYRRDDAMHFKNCFTGITGVFAGDELIGGGPGDHFGQVEVNLDLEVAMGAAPGALWKVYNAANNVALLPTMLSHMRADNIDVVSDSWGLCELFVPVKLTSVENTALELVAVSGASFYAASGDDGAADCRAANPGARFLAIDETSGQPFATAVGGTNLQAPPHTGGGRSEKAWKGSGGGISINWPKPAFQRNGRTPDVPGGFCSGGKAQCRVVPDIAMDAAPGTGYIIFSHGLGGGSGAIWGIVGGTSAAAPLMAGITADANDAAGTDIGYANPFIYQEPGTDFHDIASGSNRAPGTGTSFNAHSGFDLVTGRGSVIADRFAAALAGYTPSPITYHTTKLTGTHPLNLKRVKKGSFVTFSGVLTDKTAHHPIGNRQIIVIGNGNIIGVDRTGTSGKYEIRSKVKRRMTWHAIFMGSGSERPDLSPTHTVRIRH
jgi:subtilase family serine protease